MNFDPDSYTITIRKENVDGDLLYVGRVAEFQNITAYEETFEEAREILLDAITTLKKLAEEEGAAFPSPNVSLSDEYSGRPSLRLPKSLHAKAAILAEEEGVSLNTYLVCAIATYTGEAHGLSKATKEIAKSVRAVIYIAAKTATQFMSPSISESNFLPSNLWQKLPNTTLNPLMLPKKTRLIEAANYE